MTNSKVLVGGVNA
ncbi:Protein of unknown function [Bacillus wiedmannii]|nr:Protein of unknown function [Bacillus wiedmannii]SCM11937.1 Protein of unknown function [Bacillus wiedmannii]